MSPAIKHNRVYLRSASCRSPQEIVKQGVIEVSTRELFDLEGGGRKAKKNGALDGRMVWLSLHCGGSRSDQRGIYLGYLQ